MSALSNDAIKKILAGLSPQDFQSFGLDQIAYIRRTRIDGQELYIVSAADGTPLSMQPDSFAAEVSAMEDDLQLVTLH